MTIERIEEQELCKDCGLCCDGTLFDKAVIGRGEELELAISLNLTITDDKNKVSFKLPCHLFEGKCSIYFSNKRFNMCKTFYCKLLKKFKKIEIDFSSTLQMVQTARAKADELRSLLLTFEELSDINTVLELSRRMQKLKRSFPDEILFRKKYGNVLITLYGLNETLNRHFSDNKKKKL